MFPGALRNLDVLGQEQHLNRNQLMLAATLALAADIKAAKTTAAILLMEFPDLSIKTMRPISVARVDVCEQFADALQRAGVPAA